MNKTKFGFLASCSVAASLAPAAPATAQIADPLPPAETAGSEPAGQNDGDIVVTATRRATDIQKVPVAITAFGEETLKQISPTNIGNVLNLVPGVSFQGESTYRTSLNIRGVQGSNEDAAVAMYVDGVYVGHDLGQNLSNFDAGTIQVLRGPQGALYGKATLGGAVIVNNKAPSFETSGYAVAGYGNEGFYNIRGGLGGAIVGDVVAATASGYMTGDGGRFFNVFSGREVGRRRDYGGRAAVLVKLSDDVSLTLRGDYNRNKYQEYNRKGLFTTLNFAPGQFSPGYDDRVALDTVGDVVAKNYGTAATLVIDGDPFTITSVTAYRGYEVSSLRDFDGTGVNQGTASIYQKQHQISEEVTIVSPGRRRFNWLAGFQVYHERLDELFHIEDRVGGLIRPGLAARVPVTYDYQTDDYVTNSFGLYAQGDFEIATGLKLAAGIRYAIDDRKYLKTETQTLSNPTAIGFRLVFPERGTYDGLTPEASLTYEFSPTVSLYGKYAKSYRPGGFNVNSTLSLAGKNRFGKETADAYEAGFRSRLFDGRLTFNATAFRINWQNQQVSYLNAVGAFSVDNVQSRSQGIELDAAIRVTRALRLELAGSHLDAVFGDVTLPYRDPVTRQSSFVNARGTPLNFSPRWSGSTAVVYDRAFDDGSRVLARADVAYRTKQYVQPLRADLAGPAITRVNGRLEYGFGRYSAAVWVKNALNEFTNYIAQSTATVDVVGITDPRSYGLELSYRF